MAKQNPYRFSLGFDEEDPDHQEVCCKGGSCISSKHRRKIFKRAGGDRQEAGYTKEKQSRTITR